MSVCKVGFVLLLHALYVGFDGWRLGGQGLKFGSHRWNPGVLIEDKVAVD